MKKSLMKVALLIGFIITSSTTSSQISSYTTSNLHAHNDYEKPQPFWNAYNNGFGSIEVDVFLENGMLLVAHERKQLSKQRTLERMYLEPVATLLKKNNGLISGDSKRKLQLMIDIKSEAIPALDALIGLLKKYPAIEKMNAVSIVISGNRPPIEEFNNYPEYILFDGLPNVAYTNQLPRIPMISDNFKLHSKWNGEGIIPEEDKQRLQSVITKVHELGKKIRFWNAPDNPNAWKQLIELGVDYINTDRVKEAAEFVKVLK